MSRESILAVNIVGSLAIKGAAMLVTFLTTPAYINYFDNNSVLGSWFTIISILNWILVFDFGIGNGLRNKLVEATTHNLIGWKKSLVSSSYVALGIPCVALMIAGAAIVPLLDWNTILGVSRKLISPDVLRLAVLIVLSGILLQFWLKLIVSILYSEQKTAIANLLTLLTSVGMLVFALFFEADGLEDKLMAIAVAQSLLLNIPLIIATMVVFSRSMKDSRPSINAVCISSIKAVLGLSLGFFAIQVSLLFANSTNELLIGLLFSSEDVVDYQVYYRLFFALVSVFTILVQPMWSALTQAYEDGDIKWMRKVYRRYNLISLGGVAVAILLCIFINPIISIWLGRDAVEISSFNALTFTIWAAITMFINSSTCIANAMSKLKCQIIFCGLAALLKIPVALYLSSIMSSWIAVVIANCIVLVPLLITQIVDVRLNLLSLEHGERYGGKLIYLFSGLKTRDENER